MISANIPQDASESPSDEYTERLFLPNSRDLIRLLVQFNMVSFHPQLKGCPFSDALMAEMISPQPFEDARKRKNTGRKLARKIHQWQEQRLKNI